VAAEAQPLEVLPEAAAVHWRARVDENRLRYLGRLWTLTTVGHVVPFAAAAAVLMWLQPLALPVALACLAHAWVIPELYAQRGANVVRPRGRAEEEPERRSVGLLGDLVGEAGAVLLHGRRRRAYCYCVKVDARAVAEATGEAGLPSGDRIAHLLLALRADEQGFATVANLAFAGARWRLRRRLAAPLRPALDVAAASMDTMSTRAR
jgi:hypothetical protein